MTIIDFSQTFVPCINCGGMPEVTFDMVPSPDGEWVCLGMFCRCQMCGRKTRNASTCDDAVNEWNGGFNGCSIRR